MRRQSRCISL
ncbi:hypothetical protein RDI58_023380 [Solanum bulbocastanum]|uniref:Uncharacterized protein n=1 Tax=Solanum bulbocastanum TaxID=147425 RepID=A0AAN8Y734_SOLBU